eukprot:COSAG06_NODE_47972_length_335_cov_1.088983_1_plen_58_part_00
MDTDDEINDARRTYLKVDAAATARAVPPPGQERVRQAPKWFQEFKRTDNGLDDDVYS